MGSRQTLLPLPPLPEALRGPRRPVNVRRHSKLKRIRNLMNAKARLYHLAVVRNSTMKLSTQTQTRMG